MFNVVYSVVETHIVAQSTNIRSYTYHMSRLGQHIRMIVSWTFASEPRAGAHGSHTEPNSMVLILTRTPTTPTAAVFCAHPASKFTFVSPAPSAPYTHNSTRRAFCTSRSTTPTPDPRDHPTALLLEAVVGQRDVPATPAAGGTASFLVASCRVYRHGVEACQSMSVGVAEVEAAGGGRNWKKGGRESHQWRCGGAW